MDGFLSDIPYFQVWSSFCFEILLRNYCALHAAVVEEQVADVIYSQGYDPREFHNVSTNHGEKIMYGKRSNLRTDAIRMRHE